MRRFVLVLFGLAANANVASAQSILERVLGQIDGATNLAPVNGTYANIAESVSDSITTSTLVDTSYTPNGSEELYAVYVTGDYFGVSDAGPALFLTVTYDMLGTSGTANIGIVPFNYSVAADGTITITSNASTGAGFEIFKPGVTAVKHSGLEEFWVGGWGGSNNTATAYANGAGFYTDGSGGYYYLLPSVALSLSFDPAPGGTETQTTVTNISHTIDGSITNIITGVTAATAEVVTGTGSATVLAIPTVDLGNMSTTVLGAVDTGEITLGVNSAVDEAGTTGSRAISAAVTQIGGSADAGALVLNLAHNASAVDGSIQNTLLAVNGSAGNLATTTLGAVNTGTITSGVNAAVNGLVGMAGQSGL